MRIVLLVSFILVWHFVQNIWLNGIWFMEAETNPNNPNEISVAALNNSTPKLEDAGLLFGAYDSGEQEVEDVAEQKEDLFDERNQAYIGQLGNFKYILYATAKLSGKVSAKLLVNNLELETVELITVYPGNNINGAEIVNIGLSKLIMTQNQNSIELKLFERSK